MSNDVNKDIQAAIKAAQGDGKTNGSKNSVSIPDPRILKHSLDQSGVLISAPTKLQESNENY